MEELTEDDSVEVTAFRSVPDDEKEEVPEEKKMTLSVRRVPVIHNCF